MRDDGLILVRRDDVQDALAHIEWMGSGGWFDRLAAAVSAPVSSVVPITRIRAWIENERAVRAVQTPYAICQHLDLAELEALLDDVECASNPNNEGTT